MGTNFDFYLFSVENPVEIVTSGAKPHLRELEPVSMLKQGDRHVSQSNVKKWNTLGVAEFNYTRYFSLAENQDPRALEEKIVVPNLAMFATLNGFVYGEQGRDVPVHTIVHGMAALKVWHKLNSMILGSTAAASVLSILGIDASMVVEMQYRTGNFTRFFGQFTSNKELCTSQIDNITGILSDLISSFVPFGKGLVKSAVEGLKGLVAGSLCTGISDEEQLELGGLGIFRSLKNLPFIGDTVASKIPSAADGLFFFAFDRGCADWTSRLHTDSCRVQDVCKQFRVGTKEREVCEHGDMSEDQAAAIFSFADPRDGEGVMDWDNSDQVNQAKSALAKFMSTCQFDLPQTGRYMYMKSPVTFSPDLCGRVVDHMVHVGRFALLKGSEEITNSFLQAYGWGNSSQDMDIGKKVLPYFMKTTVGAWISAQGEGVKDPLLGGKELKLPVANNISSPTMCKGPSQLLVHSRYGLQGLAYYNMSDGKHWDCRFDRDCMAQRSFMQSQTCVPDLSPGAKVEGACKPTMARGFGQHFLPGTMFGDSNYGTDEFHRVGAQAPMFVPEVFAAAALENIEVDHDWEGVKVNRWIIRNVSRRTEFCSLPSSHLSRGIDCDSPFATVNLEYFASEDPSVRMAMYASFPHFARLVTNPGDSRFAPYFGDDRVQISGCQRHKDCQGIRNFGTELWSEPNMGNIIKGNQRLQLNVRVRRSGSTGPMRFMPESPSSNDFLLPLHWVHQYNAAKPWQLKQVAALQSVPSKIMWALVGSLVMGVALCALGVHLLRKGFALRQAKLDLEDERRSVKILSGASIESIQTVRTCA